MSNQKHKVATDALETLGTIIDENAGRDAIHLAVEPVEAGQTLTPGSHVKLVDGKAYAALGMVDGVGIVDPFLPQLVYAGQRFWLVVYPRTITSLRHVWSHPAFGEEAAPAPEKSASEQWLRDFIERVDCGGATYEEVVRLACGERVSLNEDYGHSYNTGQWILINGSDANGQIPPEFWTHIEAVTGQSIPSGMRAEHFSCSC